MPQHLSSWLPQVNTKPLLHEAFPNSSLLSQITQLASTPARWEELGLESLNVTCWSVRSHCHWASGAPYRTIWRALSSICLFGIMDGLKYLCLLLCLTQKFSQYCIFVISNRKILKKSPELTSRTLIWEIIYRRDTLKINHINRMLVFCNANTWESF